MIKTIITRKEDNVVTNLAIITEVKENGLMVDNQYIIAGIENYNVYNGIETIDAIECEKYIYTPAGGFIKNADYKTNVNLEDEIATLKSDNANINYALMMGGLL